MSRLFWRALLAFLALPGVVGYGVPLLLAAPWSREQTTRRSGLVLMVTGTALLLWCVREFSVAGRGTLAPWAPPEHLVTTGPYRGSRNPMYIAVILVLAGWALTFASWSLATYAVIVAVAFHLRVVLYEEPWLARTHGERWLQYRARVSRWIGR